MQKPTEKPVKEPYCSKQAHIPIASPTSQFDNSV